MSRPSLPCLAQNSYQGQTYGNGYHTHDATSRSHTLPNSLEESFASFDFSSPISRVDLPIENSRVFELKGILTPKECQSLIDTAENIGFDQHSDVHGEYPSNYRNNQRLIISSDQLASFLWKRISPHLTFTDLEGLTPPGWGAEGEWTPCGVNNFMLLSRYIPGMFFKPHFDGFYRNHNQETSILSISIYLNSNSNKFEGGRLLFRKEATTAEGEEEEGTKGSGKGGSGSGFDGKRFLEDEDYAKRLEELHPVSFSWVPTTGSAVIFNHDTLHEGEQITSGRKYILRTSIMFVRTHDFSDSSKSYTHTPAYQRAMQLYQSFDAFHAAGDTKGFTSAYLEAQRLQYQEGGRCVRKESKSNRGEEWPFAAETSTIIFEYVGFPQVLTCSLVCKEWRSLAASSYLWKRLFEANWPGAGETAKLYLASSSSSSFASSSSSSSSSSSWHFSGSTPFPESESWYGAFRVRYHFLQHEYQEHWAEGTFLSIQEHIVTGRRRDGIVYTASTPCPTFYATYGWDVSYPSLRPSVVKSDHCLQWALKSEKKRKSGEEDTTFYHPVVDLYKVLSTVHYTPFRNSFFIVLNPFLWHPSSRVSVIEKEVLDSPLEYAKFLPDGKNQFKEVLTFFSRLRSFGLIENFCCALLSCQQVDGIVVYENRLFSFQSSPVTVELANDSRSLWQIVKLRNLEPVEHKTLICATKKVTRMAEIKKKLLSTLEVLSEGNTSETIVFARDSQFEDQRVQVVENDFDLQIRTLRRIFTKDLVEETKKKYPNVLDLDEQGVLLGAQICTQHPTLLERILRREEQDNNQLYFL